MSNPFRLLEADLAPVQLEQSLSDMGVFVQRIYDPDTADEDSVVELVCPWISKQLEIHLDKPLRHEVLEFLRDAIASVTGKRHR